VGDGPAVPKPVHELLTFGVERLDLGLQVGRDPVDAEEEREPPVAQRVEDLALVTACPYRVAVGHEREGRHVLIRFNEIAHGAADAGEAEAGVEERDHDPERDEVLERVKGVRPLGRDDVADPLPRAELRQRAAGQPGGLRGREAHGTPGQDGSSRRQRSRQRRPALPNTFLSVPVRIELVRFSRPAFPSFRTFRSITSRHPSITRNPTTPSSSTRVNVKRRRARPATKPNTAHLIARAECRYRVVSETSWTRRGSVSLWLASISLRIRCSSSDSGMQSPLAPQRIVLHRLVCRSLSRAVQPPSTRLRSMIIRARDRTGP